MRRVLNALLCLLVVACAVQTGAQASTAYTQAVGTPPVCTSLAFKTWYNRLLTYRLNEVPRTRTTRYYVAANGADGNNGTSTATPFLTLYKAQAILNTLSSPANVEISFRDGDTWKNTTSAAYAVTAQGASTVTLSGAGSDAAHFPNNTQVNLLGGSANETLSESSFNTGTGVLTLSSSLAQTGHLIATTSPFLAVTAQTATTITVTNPNSIPFMPGQSVTVVGSATQVLTVSSFNSSTNVITLSATITPTGIIAVTWNSPQGLTVLAGNLTLDDYPSGNAGNQLPILSAFAPSYTAASWSQSVGLANATTFPNVWAIAETNPVAWLREDSDAGTVYRPASSVTNCNATKGSWYWDSSGGFLYIYPNDSNNPTLTGDKFESVYANATNGITVGNIGSGGTPVDSVRLQNVRCDGYGCGSALNGFYGIHLAPYGTQANVVVGCEAYYNGNHNIGFTGANGTSGGIVTYVNCRGGMMYNITSGTNFVGYAPNGGQEYIVDHCVGVTGDLPLAGNDPYTGATAVGSVNLAHSSNASTFPIALMIESNISNVPGQFQNSSLGFTTFAPPFTDLVNCRAFVLDSHFYVRLQTVWDSTYAGVQSNLSISPGLGSSSASPVYGAVINTVQDSRVLFMSVGTNSINLFQSGAQPIYINSIFNFDFSTSPAGAAFANNNTYRTAVTDNGFATTSQLGEYYNCRFNWLGAGRGHYSWDMTLDDTNTLATVLGPATAQPICNSLKFKNCIFSFRNGGGNAITTFRSIAIGNNSNYSDQLVNNCYSGTNNAHRSSFRGYDADPDMVEVADVPDGPPAGSTSPLYSAHQQLVGGYPLQYDAFWLPRPPFGQADYIGPYRNPLPAIIPTPRRPQ